MRTVTIQSRWGNEIVYEHKSDDLQLKLPTGWKYSPFEVPNDPRNHELRHPLPVRVDFWEEANDA